MKTMEESLVMGKILKSFWTISFWDLFIDDEMEFIMLGENTPLVKHGGGSIMLWDYFAIYNLSNIECINRILYSQGLRRNYFLSETCYLI